MMTRDVINNVICIPQGTRTIGTGTDAYISKTVDMVKAQGVGVYLTVDTVDDDTLLDNVKFIIEEGDEIDPATGQIVDPVETEERNVYTNRLENFDWGGTTYRVVGVGYGGYKKYCRFKLEVLATAGGGWTVIAGVIQGNARKYPVD